MFWILSWFTNETVALSLKKEKTVSFWGNFFQFQIFEKFGNLEIDFSAN